MLGTRAYYPKIKYISYSERSKNGQSWVHITETEKDSSVYIQHSDLIGFASSGYKAQSLDSLIKKYNLLVDSYYEDITFLRKKNGDDFDKFNSPELKSLRESKAVSVAGPVATISSKKKIFLTKIYVYLEKDYNYQEYLELLDKYSLTENSSYHSYGHTVYSLIPPLNIGEGIIEIAMELQRNKNIKHAIVETNSSPSNPLSE